MLKLLKKYSVPMLGDMTNEHHPVLDLAAIFPTVLCC